MGYIDEMRTLRYNEQSPTRAIYWILKPYWKQKKLDDQHWAYVLACLRKIEVGQKQMCLECLEREMIRKI